MKINIKALSLTVAIVWGGSILLIGFIHDTGGLINKQETSLGSFCGTDFVFGRRLYRV